MAKKEDLYITKDGEILRGEKATDYLLQKDAEELLKETGLESHMERSKEKSCDVNPYEISLNVLKSEASATGAKLSACKHKATGFAVDVGADVHASVTGAQAKVATTGMKTVDIGVNASAGVDTKGVQVRALNDSVKGVKGRVGAAVKTSATGVSVKAGNTDLAVVDAKLKAQIGAKAKGVGVQAATAKVANVQRCAYAKAEAEATGVNITAAKVAVAGEQTSAYAEAKAGATGADITAAKAKIIGVENKRGVSASAEAKGVSVKAATANIVGVQEKKVAKVETEAKGPEVNVAQFSAVGKKSGGSVSVTAEAKLGELQAGTVTLTGMDNTISGSAQMKSDIGALRAANVNAAASGGANFQATADLSLGLDVGNLEIGGNKGGSIGVSTRFQVGNIVLSGGLPSLTLAPSLNFGFGGGSRGSGSCGGKPGKGDSHSPGVAGTESTSDSGSAQGVPSGGSTTVGASTVSGDYSNRLSDYSAYRKGSSADAYSEGALADVSYSRGSNSISVHGKHSAGTGRDSVSARGVPNGGCTTVGASTVSGDYSNRLSDYSAYRKGSSADVYSRGIPADVSYSRGSNSISVHGKHSASYSGGKSANNGVNSCSRQPSSYNQPNGGDVAGFQSHSPVHDGGNSAHGVCNRQPSASPYTHTGSVGLYHPSTVGMNRVQNLTPLHSTENDFNVVSDSSLSMPGSSHTSSGFGSTHRRFSTDKIGTETKQTYGERLASMLHQKMSTLAPYGAEPDQKDKKKDATVSKDRDGAKRELSQSLCKFRKKLDEEDRLKTAGVTGAVSKYGKNGKDRELGVKANGEDKKKEKVMAPKEKPFGSKKNIHTLGCFKNESTREVMKIGGNVHGFDA